MALHQVFLEGVRIHHVEPLKTGDGKPGTVCLVDELDMPTLKASNLVAWEQSQKAEDVPATWRNKAGAPLLQYAGYEMAEKPVSTEVEAVETPKVR